MTQLSNDNLFSKILFKAKFNYASLLTSALYGDQQIGDAFKGLLSIWSPSSIGGGEQDDALSETDLFELLVKSISTESC
jgi:hypothetical protein